MNTRRKFLITAPMGAIAAAVACRGGQESGSSASAPTTAGAPPTFGTGPVSGPPVSASTFEEAEKLARVTMTSSERQVAASSWPRSLAPLLERRTGPRKISIEPGVAPATRWDPAHEVGYAVPTTIKFVRSPSESIPLPANDADIALAPVTRLSRWIEQKALTSERLTNIYLKRIEQFDPKLRAVITLTRDVA